MHPACMATKTISVDMEAYKILRRERKGRRDSYSQVIRRLYAERPALTAGELLEATRRFEGIGAGKRREKPHAAA